MADTNQYLRFGDFELDCRNRELRRSSGNVKLQEQPFQILSALLERPGEAVTREELRKRVWAGNTFVDFDNGLNVAIAKLRHLLEDHAENARFIETIPRLGYRFVAAVEVLQDVKTVIPQAPPARSFHRSWAIGLVSVVILALLVAVLTFARRSLAGAPTVTLRPAIAIMGFRNLSGNPDQAWLSEALSEMIATELAAGDHLRIVPGESVTRTKIEMVLADTDSYSAPTLGRIRKRLGADYVLVGSYLNTGGQSRAVRLDLRLQNARTGETITMSPESGGADDLTALVAQAGSALRQRLEPGAVSQSEASGARATLPPNSDTARLYAEGLSRLRRFDARGARDLLGQAVAADPNYALAHAALSDAWSVLGYAAVARDEARKAWDLSAKLPPTDRLSIEARYREANSEWDQAIRIYQKLFLQFPDNADYGFRLAGAQISAGKANEAMATLDKLHHLPPLVADEAAIQFVRSQAAEKLGDFERAQASADAAATTAHARGAEILEADARALECRQLVQLSRLDQAVTACGAARPIYARTGNRLGLAATMAYLAAAYCNQGNINEARSLYTQALDINHEIGNARSDAQWALNGLAVLLLRQGDFAGARKLYRESLDMARAAGSPPDEVSALGNIASTWLNEGDLRKARELFDQALKRSRSIGAKAVVGSLLNNMGHALYLSGDLTGAAQALDEAIRTDRETGAKLESADSLALLGCVRVAQANWADAKQRFDESVRAAQEIQGQLFSAQYQMEGAELPLAMGTGAEAEALIRRSLDVLRSAKAPARELEARVLLVRALLEEGKVAEAQRELPGADTLVRSSGQRALGLEFAIVSARAEAASGDPAAAERAARSLRGTIAEAGRAGYLGYQLEARLALGEIESSEGRADARQFLAKLEQDAHAKGFESLAQRAARDQKKS